jgi:hypothetical protein
MYKTSFKQKIILIIFSLFLCAVLLEVGLRIGGFIFFSLQEYKNRRCLKKEGVYKSMCLGESTTALGGEFSFPRQLEALLNQRNAGIKFGVVNAGAPAIDSSGILSLLEVNLNRYKPQLVVCMMGINDSGDVLRYKNSPFLDNVFFKTFKNISISKVTLVAYNH